MLTVTQTERLPGGLLMLLRRCWKKEMIKTGKERRMFSYFIDAAVQEARKHEAILVNLETLVQTSDR